MGLRRHSIIAFSSAKRVCPWSLITHRWQVQHITRLVRKVVWFQRRGGGHRWAASVYRSGLNNCFDFMGQASKCCATSNVNFSILPGRGSEKAFNDCLECLSNVFPSTVWDHPCSVFHQLAVSVRRESSLTANFYRKQRNWSRFFNCFTYPAYVTHQDLVRYTSETKSQLSWHQSTFIHCQNVYSVGHA